MQKWPSDDVRRASVNSLGYGGTNAHIITENVGNLSKKASTFVTNERDQNDDSQNDYHENDAKHNGVHKNGHQRKGLGSASRTRMAVN